jgi:hypothetical protein
VPVPAQPAPGPAQPPVPEEDLPAQDEEPGEG